MERAKKEYRELTVSEACSYGRTTASMLRIQGRWFEELRKHGGELTEELTESLIEAMTVRRPSSDGC